MYAIRIKGQLGATALSAFPSMAYQLIGGETVLTGWLEDPYALFGVLAQIDGVGLETAGSPTGPDESAIP